MNILQCTPRSILGARFVLAATFVVLAAPGALAEPPASSPELRGRLDEPAQTEPLSPRNASYAIDVALDSKSRTLGAREVVRYRNTTETPMSEVQLHLYLNAFKNPESTFVRESGGSLRGDKITEGEWGSIDVRQVLLLGGAGFAEGRELGSGGDLDLTSDVAGIQPDDANPQDQTVVRIPLPSPIPPGEDVELEIAWEAKLPRVFARTGYAGSFQLVGQWFPKVGVFEQRTPGEPATWNAHQFHATSEFFSDYGIYDVTIRTEPDAVVGATGALVGEPSLEGGMKVHRYRAEDVHDFAFTSDPDFKERTERWNDVEIRLLYQPAHESLVDLHMQAARRGLEFFTKAYGPYPYRTLTMVDPGPGAGGASGMEYPTFITVGASVHSISRSRPYRWLATVRDTEITILHEFGHQYWYGLVGSNEFEESWLDEGFNSYSESKVLTEPVAEFLGGRIVLPDLGLHKSSYVMFPHEGAILTPTWEFPSFLSWGVASYAKPAVVLRTLENTIGEAAMERLMRSYFEQYRFRHPRSEDFFRLAEEVSGQELDPLWDQFVRRDMSLDYAVRSVTAKVVESQPGLYDVDGKRVEVTAEEARKKRKEEKKAAKGERVRRTRVIFERRREGILPVDWEVRFSDDSVEKGTWDGRTRILELEYEKAARPVVALLDPERKLLLDVNRANDSMIYRAPSDDEDEEPSKELEEAEAHASRASAALSAVTGAVVHMLLLAF